MDNKILNTLSILGLITVVSVMSWRDMHPKIDDGSSSLGTITYYAGTGITPAMIPDDHNWPITMGLGEFSTTPDGKAVWAPNGQQPATIAQRQVNLQFHFKSMPHDTAETVKIIKTVADDWKRKGDIINILLLDYSAEKPDLKAYAALLKAAHDAFLKSYVICAGVNILWADGPQKDALKDLQDDSPQFLIHLPQAHISPEFLSRLEAFKYNFILQFPAGTLPGDIDVTPIKKLGFLTSLTLTLDPHKPLPKKEEKIGLFPKL